MNQQNPNLAVKNNVVQDIPPTPNIEGASSGSSSDFSGKLQVKKPVSQISCVGKEKKGIKPFIIVMAVVFIFFGGISLFYGSRERVKPAVTDKQGAENKIISKEINSRKNVDENDIEIIDVKSEDDGSDENNKNHAAAEKLKENKQINSSLMRADNMIVAKIISYRYNHGILMPAYYGSASIISSDGILLTNSHVIYDEDNAKLFDAFLVCITKIDSADKEPICEFVAHFLAHNPKLNSALLKMDTENFIDHKKYRLNTVSLQNRKIVVGDEITVIGYSGNIRGIVASIRGYVKEIEDDDKYQWIRTDAESDTGNSGGLVLNMDSEFIGVPTVFYEDTDKTRVYIRPASNLNDWVGKNKESNERINGDIDKMLISQRKTYHDIKTTNMFTNKDPNISFALGDDWKMEEFIDYRDIVKRLTFQHIEYDAQVSINIEKLPYSVNSEEIIRDPNGPLADFQPMVKNTDKKKIGSVQAEMAEISIQNKKMFYYLFTVKNYLVTLFFTVRNSDLNKLKGKISNVLENIKTKETIDAFDFVPDEKVVFNNINVIFNRIPNWYFNLKKLPDEKVYLYKKEEDIKILTQLIHIEGEKNEMTAEEFLSEMNKKNLLEFEEYKIVEKIRKYKYNNIIGAQFVFETRNKNKKLLKMKQIVIRRGDYILSILIAGEKRAYEENADDIKKILDKIEFGKIKPKKINKDSRLINYKFKTRLFEGNIVDLIEIPK